MDTIQRRSWAVLSLSLVVELLVVTRPRLAGLSADTLCLVDLVLQMALLLGIPAAMVKYVLGGGLHDVGLCLAGARHWLRWWTPLFAVSLLLALLCTRLPSIHEAYPRLPAARSSAGWFILSTLTFASYGLAWEFFFRGFLLFGIEQRFGSWAVVVQGVPCALMHWGKPNFELLCALPAAILLGIMALRARSIVPGFVLHASVALCVNLGCLFWPLGSA